MTITEARESLARSERAFPGQDFVIVAHPRDGHQVRDAHHTGGYPAVEGRACRACGRIGSSKRWFDDSGQPTAEVVIGCKADF